MSEDQQVFREVLNNLGCGDKLKGRGRGLPQSGKSSKHSRAEHTSKAVQDPSNLPGRTGKPQKPVTAEGGHTKKECPTEQRYGFLQLEPVSHEISSHSAGEMPGVKRPAAASSESPPERNRPPNAVASQPTVGRVRVGKLSQLQDNAASPVSGTPPVPRSQQCCDYGSPMQDSPQVTFCQ